MKRMYGSSKSGESREERTMTRGLFLRTDTDMKTVTAVWRRVMGVLCGRYPAWLLDSFNDCLGGKTDPDGAYTSREFKQWLDGEHYILFARAFGYTGEVARETVCDYEDYQRAACRCAGAHLVPRAEHRRRGQPAARGDHRQMDLRRAWHRREPFADAAHARQSARHAEWHVRAQLRAPLKACDM